MTGTDGQAGDATYNTPCNTTYSVLSPPAIFLMNTRIVIIMYGIVVNLKLMQHSNLASEVL